MKFSLVVAHGVNQGKEIPIQKQQFLIGRDPQCHLRPSSAAVSKRHCGLLIKNNKVFVRDLGSTNGTFVNDEQVEGERELHDTDQLKIGPLEFTVKLELPAPVKAATPARKVVEAEEEDAPTVKDESAVESVEASDKDGPQTEDRIAELLLEMGGDDPPSEKIGEESIPDGTTVMELPAIPNPDKSKGPPKAAASPTKAGAGNSSAAADQILKKYLKRPRS